MMEGHHQVNHNWMDHVIREVAALPGTKLVISRQENREKQPPSGRWATS